MLPKSGWQNIDPTMEPNDHELTSGKAVRLKERLGGDTDEKGEQHARHA